MFSRSPAKTASDVQVVEPKTSEARPLEAENASVTRPSTGSGWGSSFSDAPWDTSGINVDTFAQNILEQVKLRFCTTIKF